MHGVTRLEANGIQGSTEQPCSGCTLQWFWHCIYLATTLFGWQALTHTQTNSPRTTGMILEMLCRWRMIPILAILFSVYFCALIFWVPHLWTLTSRSPTSFVTRVLSRVWTATLFPISIMDVYGTARLFNLRGDNFSCWLREHMLALPTANISCPEIHAYGVQFLWGVFILGDKSLSPIRLSTHIIWHLTFIL